MLHIWWWNLFWKQNQKLIIGYEYELLTIAGPFNQFAIYHLSIHSRVLPLSIKWWKFNVEWECVQKEQAAALLATWSGKYFGSAVPIFRTFALCIYWSLHLPVLWPTCRWNAWWYSSKFGQQPLSHNFQTAPGVSWCQDSNSSHHGSLHKQEGNTIRRP